ncbi:GGDEF domain-containing protein [Vibrio sp. S9_S30]|uniref:tetratricopeptide repeat-containing diguanylate cyclase n=1 Tax=Vibrio sp. S9_S30 TaxID=2720226 RepID=UPI00167FE6AE|nr:GGDEF domain-containing protein [Vibrio sp. S9_S30]MBD1556697.1 GGDEF domain-containing protein [Vibrio sp. S9_S30]
MNSSQWQTDLLQHVRNIFTSASAEEVVERQQKIRELSEKHGHSIPVEFHSFFSAYTLYRGGKLIPALREFFDCVSLCQTHQQHYLLLIAYFNIGTIFGLLGDHSHASEFLTKAERIHKYGDKRLVSLIKNNIGDLFAAVGQHRNAIDYFTDAIKGLEEDEFQFALISYMNLAGSHIELKQYEEAKAIFDILEVHAFGNMRYLSFYHQKKAKYYLAVKEISLAEKQLDLALKAINQCKNDYYLSEIALDYCELLLVQSKWDELDNRLESGLSLARKTGANNLIDKFNQILLSRIEQMPTGEERDRHYQLMFVSLQKSRESAITREHDYLSQIYQLNMDRLALESAQDINKNLRLINKIGQYLSTCDNFKDVIFQLVEDLKGLFKVDTLAIGFYQPQHNRIFIEHYYDDNEIKDALYIDFSEQATFFEYCGKNKCPLYFNDMTIDKKKAMLGRSAEHENQNSLLFAPITINSEVNAIFTIQATDCYAYQTYQYELFLQLTNYLSIALENQINRKKLTLLSQTDHLTRLWNRQSLDAHYLDLQKQRVSEYSIVMIDIDCYKQLNDYYGHVEGDKVLVTLTQLIKENFERLDAKCYRYGGDEFVVVVPNHDVTSLTQTVQNIQHALYELKIPNKRSYCADRVSLSIGVAHFSHCASDLTLSDSLHHADTALYQAKRSGRNQFAVTQLKKTD